MIEVKIGEAVSDIRSASEGWINQQINQRKADGLSVCVKVTIKEEGLDMVLLTPTCPSGGGGSRPPRNREQKLFDLWNKRGLNRPDFTGGNLVAFLKQLKNAF